MKNFCSKCGTPIDAATGLCPNCDREKIEAITAQNIQNTEAEVFVKKYCDQCGADLDPETGKCSNPNCGSSKTLGTENLFLSDLLDKKSKDGSSKKKPTAVTTIFTVLLSIVLFFTSACAVVIYDVRNTLDEDNIERLFEDVEATDLLETVKKSGESKEVEDFYHNMEVKYGVNMDDDRMNDFINRSNAKEVIAEKVADFGEDFFENDAELVVEKEEVIEFLEDNSREFEREFDVELTYKMTKDIADNFLAKDEVVIIDMRELEDEVPALYDAATIGLSYWTMFGLIVFSILIIFLMYLNGWSQAMNGVGITFVSLSGTIALIAILGVCLSSVWENIIGGSYIGVIIGNFMAINVWPGIILFVLGIGLIVGRVLLKKYLSKKQAAIVVEDVQQ